nr:MAG TPA: hypothetical protein [Caudoviricetes sp.]
MLIIGNQQLSSEQEKVQRPFLLREVDASVSKWVDLNRYS